MHNTTILVIVIILFFSGFYFAVARFVFYFLIVKRGVKADFGLAGVPGYIESLYLKAGDNIRSPGLDRFLLSYVVSFFIALISGLSLFLFIRYQHLI